MRTQKYFSKSTLCKQLHKHQSKKEALRCDELTRLEREGIIKWLKQQPKFELQPKFRYRGKGVRAIVYQADFSYYDTESKKFTVEDTKGYKTELYQVKKKLLIFKNRDREDFLFLES